ncbi:MAG TPA: plastocyanin/azurin family copper-binding protein [Longimicrobium sp.]|jgi:plastocyanin
MNLFIRGCSVALAVALAGCSGGGGGGGGGGTPVTPTPNPPATGVVTVRLTPSLAFSPADVTLTTGASVRWVNDAAVPHTITPDDATQGGAWPSQNVSDAGASFERTFAAAGDYPYHCNLHAGMHGTVHVRNP